MVGPGARGLQLMDWIHRLSRAENLELTGVCDIWNERRESAVEMVKAWTGRVPHACRTMAEMCERKDIDVLVVSTVDFQHAPLARQAVEAGKDVYVEKPFGCDFEQIKLAREAIRASDRVFQAGTQLRSNGVPWAAHEFIAKGRLGKVSFVELVQPLFHQRWRIPGAETALTEKDTNWKEFLCYAPQVPFNARHYREFRLFWPYSTGIFCQWMSHIIDLVNLVLGERPKAVVAAGGTYVWNDGRTNPDTAHCLVEYPSGCLMSYHMRLGNGAHARPLTFYGTNGTLDLDAGVAYGDGGGGEVILANPGSLIPELIVDASRRLPDRHQGATILDAEPDGDHMVDFFRAVRTRCPTRAGVDAAFNHALATTMAGMSWRLGARIEYDPIADSLNVGEPRKR
ncbi:MAG: Gfo/Idh/MocA family oxidoreductase [Phycisphaerae bacterium]|nr:Gfo/Idh/MocA family oxidoreductase [Phycisphaerae bacterium]